MRQPPPTSTDRNSTDFKYLQDSSLLTQIPPLPSSSGTPPALLPPEQKILSPAETDLAQFDSQGGIRVNLSVPASVLILRRLLNKGSFGTVYEGVYQGKSVAIKQLNGHLSTDALAELKREAEIMFHLGISSEHIVKLIKICLEMPYSLIMELMPEGSLYDVLHNGQNLPWQTRYQIAADAAQGLSDLHERKILHRDLKSLNILLRNGRAKLADFGLAKVKHETSSQSSHRKVGTLLWMAPELFDDEPHITLASDIYSFGMVLWELVTRKLPYAKWRHEVVGTRIAQGKKEEIPSDCPSALQKIIELCWETTPTKRPTAIQVLTNLKPLAEQKISLPDNSESEIKKLKTQMEQMKLAHERQLAEEKQRLAAAEKEKQRLASEKQAEIERIKQQHQAELKRTQEDLKRHSPIQPPKSISSLPPLWDPISRTFIPQPTPMPSPSLLPLVSQTIAQIILPPPKPKTSSAQLLLQDQLIRACKQGDEKTVKAFLQQGAQPDIANAQGEQPLGAAVWGMCPDVVNALLKQAGGIAPMTWQECEQHNKKHYNNEVFIISKFEPRTFEEWNTLLQKMDPNPFIRVYHLKKADEQWHNKVMSSWDNMKKMTWLTEAERRGGSDARNGFVTGETEKGFVSYRSQIKQSIESAKQPTTKQISHDNGKAAAEEEKHQTMAQPPKSPPLPSISQTIMARPKPKARPEQLVLQKQLIVACERGDAEEVEKLLKQGANPDIANAEDKYPLGAAVWGMCPDVVNALLKQAGGIAPMTWDECEKHNQRFYQEVFILPKFDPRTYSEWYQLLLRINPYPFIRAFHLKMVNDECDNYYGDDFHKLKDEVRRREKGGGIVGTGDCNPKWRLQTEAGCVSYRSQIKQWIETAKQPIKLAQEDLKYETPFQPPQLTTPLSISQTIPQTIMAPPKPKARPEQLVLQKQLIVACERGNAKEVEKLLKQGAKPDMANAEDKYPLGAAVWGMCPDVVNALLKQTGGIAPMAWDECEKHNQRFYQEVFIIPKFDPQSFGEWDYLLQKMDPNPFIRTYHLRKVDEQCYSEDTSSWDYLKRYVNERVSWVYLYMMIGQNPSAALGGTETGFASYRSQIKQEIETAKQPTVAQRF